MVFGAAVALAALVGVGLAVSARTSSFHRQAPPPAESSTYCTLPASEGDIPWDSQILEGIKNRTCSNYADLTERHGWATLAHMVETGEGPVDPLWRKKNWKTKCAFYPSIIGCPHVGSGGASAMDRLLSGTLSAVQLNNQPPQPGHSGSGISGNSGTQQLSPKQSNAPFLATVYYSDEVSNWISNDKLNSIGTFEGMLQAGSSAIPDKLPTPLPRTAIVVKAIWEVLYLDKRHNSIGVYVDPRSKYAHRVQLDSGDDTRFTDISSWPQVVINKNPWANCKSQNYETQDDGAREPVPLNCFYHRYATASQVATLKNNLQTMGRDLPPDAACYILLVGLQVMSKELDNWVWTTYWWAPDAYDTSTYGPRPSDLKLNPAFSHFLMNSTFSDAESSGNGPKICFNPYLEGVSSGGITSNCMSCHERAVYRPGPTGIGPDLTAAEKRQIAPQTPPGLQTAFLWSITSPNGPKPNEGGLVRAQRALPQSN
jgi:hypothetical protein